MQCLKLIMLLTGNPFLSSSLSPTGHPGGIKAGIFPCPGKKRWIGKHSWWSRTGCVSSNQVALMIKEKKLFFAEKFQLINIEEKL